MFELNRDLSKFSYSKKTFENVFRVKVSQVKQVQTKQSKDIFAMTVIAGN